MESGRVRGAAGRFEGPRRNVETVPRLPSRAVSKFIRDPREIPYVVLWTDPETAAIARVARLERGAWEEADPGRPEMVQLRDPNGDVGLELVRAAMPLGHGEALLLTCFDCERPRRHLYGAGLRAEAEWLCRRCSGLRYSSEGQYVGNRWWRVGMASGEPWDPFVYSTPQAAAEAHGTSIEAEPLLQAWFRLGTAPLRPKVRRADPSTTPFSAQDRPPAPVAQEQTPGDWNAIAMRARVTGVSRGELDMSPIRPRRRVW